MRCPCFLLLTLLGTSHRFLHWRLVNFAEDPLNLLVSLYAFSQCMYVYVSIYVLYLLAVSGLTSSLDALGDGRAREWTRSGDGRARGMDALGDGRARGPGTLFHFFVFIPSLTSASALFSADYYYAVQGNELLFGSVYLSICNELPFGTEGDVCQPIVVLREYTIYLSMSVYLFVYASINRLPSGTQGQVLLGFVG